MPSTALTEKQARKKVREIREFYMHAVSFVMVNVLLVTLNLVTSPDHLWFIYPLLGWGLGFVSHAFQVLGTPGLGRDWEAAKMRELMQDAVTKDELRGLVSSELAAREGGKPVDVARLQQRIEHLEAIVTSRDWDLLDEPLRSPLPADDSPETETPQERTAELARRVR